MTLYCYRDILDYDTDEQENEEELHGYNSPRGHQYPPGYGVTLYFATSDPTEPQRTLNDSFDVARVFDLAHALTQIVQGKGHSSAVSAVSKWIGNANPIVQFFLNCIEGGAGQNKCLALAKTAGIKYRRQNALALYKILEIEIEFSREEQPPKSAADDHADFEKYEDVRDHFKRQFMQDEYFNIFNYEKSELSECPLEGIDLEPGDFVFEVGEMNSGTLKYNGHYHAATRKFKPIHIFPGFDVQGLFLLLR